MATDYFKNMFHLECIEQDPTHEIHHTLSDSGNIFSFLQYLWDITIQVIAPSSDLGVTLFTELLSESAVMLE